MLVVDVGDEAIRLRLAENVKRLRRERGLSLEGLSSELEEVGRGLGTNALWKIEKGTRGTSAEDLLALSLVLDASVAELLLPKEVESPEREDTSPAKRPLKGLPVTERRALAPARYLDLIGATAHPEIIRTVTVTDPQGAPFLVNPGDHPPGWALLQITNPTCYLGGEVPPMLRELQKAAEAKSRQKIEDAADRMAAVAARSVEKTVAPLLAQVREHLDVVKADQEQWATSREWTKLDQQVALQRLNAVMSYAIERGVPAEELLEVSNRAEVEARGGAPDMKPHEALEAQLLRFMKSRSDGRAAPVSEAISADPEDL